MSIHWRFETSTVHAGYAPTGDVPAVSMPIYQTAAFAFEDTQHAADLFDQAVPGYIYTRISNPEGGDWFVVTTVVEDPQYLGQPFITSSNFKKEPDGSKWHPVACRQS